MLADVSVSCAGCAVSSGHLFDDPAWVQKRAALQATAVISECHVGDHCVIEAERPQDLVPEPARSNVEDNINGIVVIGSTFDDAASDAVAMRTSPAASATVGRTSARRFVCGNCDIAFASAGQLDRHEERHIQTLMRLLCSPRYDSPGTAASKMRLFLPLIPCCFACYPLLRL